MQRVPTRQRQFVPNGNAAKRPQGGEASPFLRIARRIREEQGLEQLRAFLAAMVPFVAPNELKGVCTGFGLDYDSIVLLRNEQTSRQASRMNRGESASGNVNAGGMNRIYEPVRQLRQRRRCGERKHGKHEFGCGNERHESVRWHESVRRSRRTTDAAYSNAYGNAEYYEERKRRYFPDNEYDGWAIDKCARMC